MYFNLDVRDYGRRDEEQGDGGRWDYTWSEDHCYSYNGAYIVDTEDQWGDVALFPGETEPKKGDVLLLVIVDYDTGDSFGRESGRHTVLWAFTDLARAGRLVHLIDSNSRDKKTRVEFEGVEVYTGDWKGYFEYYNHCAIETVFIK